jgi:hypothetical protein
MKVLVPLLAAGSLFVAGCSTSTLSKDECRTVDWRTDSCPADLAPAFVEAYDSGRQLYIRTRRVADAEAAIDYRHREIARLEDAAARRTFILVSETATPEERAQALLDTKQVAERIGRLKAEIADYEKERARAQYELDDYRATVAAAY